MLNNSELLDILHSYKIRLAKRYIRKFQIWSADNEIFIETDSRSWKCSKMIWHLSLIENEWVLSYYRHNITPRITKYESINDAFLDLCDSLDDIWSNKTDYEIEWSE